MMVRTKKTKPLTAKMWKLAAPEILAIFLKIDETTLRLHDSGARSSSRTRKRSAENVANMQKETLTQNIPRFIFPSNVSGGSEKNRASGKTSAPTQRNPIQHKIRTPGQL
jgi:hypothetical protein